MSFWELERLHNGITPYTEDELPEIVSLWIDRISLVSQLQNENIRNKKRRILW